MKDMRELVGDLSQTNHYMVSFSTLNSTLMSYIQNRIGFQEDVRNFVLDSKQKNLDLLFVFHALASVPLELARIADILVIKKTSEALTPTLKKKFPTAQFEKAFSAVNNSKDRYTHKAIHLL